MKSNHIASVTPVRVAGMHGFLAARQDVDGRDELSITPEKWLTTTGTSSN
jgi:hypothetical protein